MKRRDFLEALPAGMVALRARGARISNGDSLPRARWIDNGLIDAGGSHEPYLFVVRRGGQRLDALREYEAAQSESVIRALKEQGIEVFHTHLYKGFGMAAELPEMQDAVRVASIAHRLGLKVDSYIQWNTLMYETFFVEEPRAKDWVQRDSLDRPIMLTYGYQQAYRYRPCFKNQDYLNYLKKIVRFAVQEVRTDFIHFDNFDLNPEPDSCHCPWCVRGFREYLRTKYNPEQCKERFGFSDVSYVSPPEWNVQNPPAKMQVIFDPAIQEWIDFRCQFMADALRQMASCAKSLNREVVIEVNPHGITGGNRAWEAGLDHSRFLPLTQSFWTEEPNVPGAQPDGRVISKIRSYKLARAFGNILLTYISMSELAAAECLAFNQTIGYAGNHPLSEVMRKYVDFYRANRFLFQKTWDLADVTVFRSYPSITYNNARCQLSAILAEQALIEAAVPFHLIFEQHLDSLTPYRVLILPHSECLSDSQIQKIRRYVERGGGLVVVGTSGMYDQWRRLRTTPGLAGLIDQQMPARAYEERVQGYSEEGQEQRKQVGKGRVFYLPSLRFDGPLPELGTYFKVDNRFWKTPANARQFLEGVTWARNAGASVEVEGPKHLIANAVEQPERRMTLVHLVNYNVGESPMGSARVTCRNPKAVRAASVRLYGPDLPEQQELKFDGRGNAATFVVPQPETYIIAAVEWA
jgi:hypothetical protein